MKPRPFPYLNDLRALATATVKPIDWIDDAQPHRFASTAETKAMTPPTICEYCRQPIENPFDLLGSKPANSPQTYAHSRCVIGHIGAKLTLLSGRGGVRAFDGLKLR